MERELPPCGTSRGFGWPAPATLAKEEQGKVEQWGDSSGLSWSDVGAVQGKLEVATQGE